MENKEKIKRFIDKALKLPEDDSLGFMVRSLVQATMPHSKPTSDVFVRENGHYTLTMIANPKFGLPYGPIPRLILSWLTTQAIKTKSRVIDCGPSFQKFLKEIGKSNDGRTYKAVHNQLIRLTTCKITCERPNKTTNLFIHEALGPISYGQFWWEPEKIGSEEETFKNAYYVRLDENFYNEIIQGSVVFRLNTMKLLKESSLAIDIYIWITYKNSYTKTITRIPWTDLQVQFGVGYPQTPQGKRDFKKRFLAALEKVKIVYPEAGKLQATKDFLIFIPGAPDILKRVK